MRRPILHVALTQLKQLKVKANIQHLEKSRHLNHSDVKPMTYYVSVQGNEQAMK